MQPPEQGENSVVTALFRHNAWANRKLLDFCEGLTEEQLGTTAVGGYGAIRSTLVHIIGAEVSYVNRVNGRLPPTPMQRGQFPGFDVLKQAAQWTSDEMLQLSLGARAQTVVREQEGRAVAEYPLADLMAQAITHSCEHRTQVATILTQLGLEPPDMSNWCYMVETGIFRESEEPPQQE
jgi:uncharacterized damage-inducible protein DinB